MKYYKTALEYLGNSREDVDMKKSIYTTLVKDYIELKQYGDVDGSIKNALKYMKSNDEKASLYKTAADKSYNNVYFSYVYFNIEDV